MLPDTSVLQKGYWYAAASFKMHQPMAVAFEFQTARKHTEDAA